MSWLCLVGGEDFGDSVDSEEDVVCEVFSLVVDFLHGVSVCEEGCFCYLLAVVGDEVSPYLKVEGGIEN